MREPLPEFHSIVQRFGLPQIRAVATLAGNVAHGSPIADSLALLAVMDAELELCGRHGSRRVDIGKRHADGCWRRLGHVGLLG